jgi:hypothetical protein
MILFQVGHVGRNEDHSIAWRIKNTRLPSNDKKHFIPNSSIADCYRGIFG